MCVLKRITPALTLLLREARLSALQEAPSAFGSTYEEECRLSQAEWLQRASTMDGVGAAGYLVLDEGRPCGMVRGTRDQSDLEHVHLESMWVDPEYRKAGLGSKLISAVELWAIGHGAAELLLHVTSNNEAAIRLYQGHGFQATGRTEPYPNDDKLFEIEMCKRLA